MTASTRSSSARPRRLAAALSALALWSACANDGDRAQPATGVAGHANSGSANAGGVRAQGGTAGTTQAGRGGSAGGRDPAGAGAGGNGDGDSTGGIGPSDGGVDGEGSSGGGTGGVSGAGTAAGAGRDSTPVPIGACAALLGTDGARSLAISTSSLDQFGAITPDETVMAWTTVEAGNVRLHTAERASPEEAFEAAEAQPIAAAMDRVTLSPDGLRIVYVNADRRGFSSLTRERKGDSFSLADSFEFLLLNAEEAALPETESYGDPVLSGADFAFVYSRFGNDRSRTLFVAHRFSQQAPWQVGQELAIDERFSANAADRFQPTALTADELTLFLWHAADSQAFAVQLDLAQLRFIAGTELGALAGAAPNRDCSRIYYDSGGDEADLWTAESR